MRITDDKKQLIVQLYKEGYTQKKIAYLTGVSIRSISNILKSYNYTESLESRINKLEIQIQQLTGILNNFIKAKLVLKDNKIKSYKLDNVLVSKNELLNIATQTVNINNIPSSSFKGL